MEITKRDDDGQTDKKAIFKETNNIEAEPCEWISDTKFEFTLESGDYMLTATENNIDGEHAKSKNFFLYNLMNNLIPCLPTNNSKNIIKSIKYNVKNL